MCLPIYWSMNTLTSKEFFIHALVVDGEERIFTWVDTEKVLRYFRLGAAAPKLSYFSSISMTPKLTVPGERQGSSRFKHMGMGE